MLMMESENDIIQPKLYRSQNLLQIACNQVKMWLEVERYMMQVKENRCPCFSPNFNFCRNTSFSGAPLL